MKYCDLIGAATIVAAHTSSVYGCDQTLLQRVPPSNQKSERRKRVGNARLILSMDTVAYRPQTAKIFAVPAK